MKYISFIVVLLFFFISCDISYPSGIIADYPFNGNLNDYKLAEVAINHGEIDFERTTTKIGLKLKKSNELNYLELPNIQLNNTEFSIVVCVNIDSFDHNNSIFFYGSDDETWGTSGLWLYTEQKKMAVFLENQFLIRENYKSKNVLNSTFENSKNLDAKKNYYITLTYKDTKLKLFVDAQEYAVYDNVKPFSKKERKALVGIANDPKIGGKFQYEGVIDEIKIYNKSLNREQIHALYHSYKQQ